VDKKRFFSMLFIAILVTAILIDMGRMFEGGESVLCRVLVYAALGLIIIVGLLLLVLWGREFWQDYKQDKLEEAEEQNESVDFVGVKQDSIDLYDNTGHVKELGRELRELTRKGKKGQKEEQKESPRKG